MARPTAEQVTHRLRRLAELSENARPRSGVDYAPEAITSRLQEVADLSELCAQLLALGAAARPRSD